MVSNEEIKRKLEEKREGKDDSESYNLEDENPGYLICKDCNGYYKLQEGESPDDPQNLRFWDTENEVFECFDKCDCGGELVYTESIEEFFDESIEKSVEPPSDSGETVVCPSCGKENPAKNKFCTECGQKLQD